MRNILKLTLPTIAAAGLLWSMVARADSLNFTITSPTEYTAQGTMIWFDATVTAPADNTGDVYLLGDSNNLTALTVDDTYYLLNWPVDLTPGQSYSDALFSVTVPADTPPGDYAGSFTIEAYSSATPTIDVTQPFDLVVTPEPSSTLLFVTGLIGLAFVIRRRESMAS
jgi:hypothetical protein